MPGSALRHRLHRLAESQLLFPTIFVVIIIIIWSTTGNLIRFEREAAERRGYLSSRELVETYEAQVLRALREIDRTLKFVKYVYELQGGGSPLETLRDRDLLLPDLLFVVAIADIAGNVVVSTRPVPMANIARLESFRGQREGGDLLIERPFADPRSGEWTLLFTRRLDGPDGRFAGVVFISVEAAYFVSGYESAKLGDRGLLGIVGNDGVYRVRRSGETVSAGQRIDFGAAVPDADNDEIVTVLRESPIDRETRYVSTRRLYELPFAVVVGLSREELLEPAAHSRGTYLWRAAAGSLLVALLVAMLWRMSHQLARARQQAVNEQMAHAAYVEELAFHDILTGLPNRRLFSQLLDQAIRQTRRYDKQLAVLFLDIDRFKQINDSFGHEAGDTLLQEFARRLKACLRESDTVARFGGDEFVVLLPRLEDDSYADTVARKILAAVARPIDLGGSEFRMTVSIGVSICPRDGEDEDTLSRNADSAMYRAKQAGRNQYRFHAGDADARSLERAALEVRLRNALERNQFELHYHARRDIRGDRVTGMEALLRWRDPELGTLAPMTFLDVAEESGLIVAIGRWVLRTACRDNVSWQRQGLGKVVTAVNLSTRQFFDDRLVADIAETLESTGLDPGLLELEMSEAVLTRDVERARTILTGLKKTGIRIAIDDFGIGYSSLSLFRRFPLDTIKIDRSFIRDITSVDDSRALTDAIIAMGRALGLTVVAQGVETAEQADLLRRRPCGELQGFYLDKPLPASEVCAMLRRQAGARGMDTSSAAPR